jgi:hypothetical protein
MKFNIFLCFDIFYFTINNFVLELISIINLFLQKNCRLNASLLAI